MDRQIHRREIFNKTLNVAGRKRKDFRRIVADLAAFGLKMKKVISYDPILTCRGCGTASASSWWPPATSFSRAQFITVQHRR